MNHSLRLTAALLGALVMPLSVMAAKPEPVAPAPVATDAITLADVKSLQAAIKSLHERFEAQGNILLKNSGDLGTLTNRVDDYLKPSTLDPFKTGLAAVVNKLADVQQAQGNLATSQEKLNSETASRIRELTAELTRLEEQMVKSDRAADASSAQLRQSLAASLAPVHNPAHPTEASLPLLPLLGAVGAATLLVVVLLVLLGRARNRSQQTAQQQLLATLGQVRDSLLAEIQTRSAAPPAVAPVAAAVVSAGADGLAESRGQSQSAPEQPADVALPVHPDDHTTRNFSASSPDELPTVPHRVPLGSGISSAACWPAEFMNPASPLSQWRERIESHLSSREHPALPVFSSFLALRTLCVRQPAPVLEEVGAAVIALSQALYAYWDSLPDLSDDDRARANSDWIQAVKSLASSAAPKLEIREIFVGARFDSDSMQTVQEGPGNHLSVAAVFSWATLDRSGERVKILQRARIATN